MGMATNLKYRTKAQLANELKSAEGALSVLREDKKAADLAFDALLKEKDRAFAFAKLMLDRVKIAEAKTLSLRVFHGDIPAERFEQLREQQSQQLDKLYEAFNPQQRDS